MGWGGGFESCIFFLIASIFKKKRQDVLDKVRQTRLLKESVSFSIKKKKSIQELMLLFFYLFKHVNAPWRLAGMISEVIPRLKFESLHVAPNIAT